MVGGDADLEGLVREALSVVEVALEERERRLEPDHEVALHRLAQVLDDLGRGACRPPRVIDARKLEEVTRAVHVADVRELGVADALADGDELGRHGEPGVEVAGIGERGVRVGERERKRVVITDTSRHLDGLRADDEAPLLLRREVQLE